MGQTFVTTVLVVAALSPCARAQTSTVHELGSTEVTAPVELSAAPTPRVVRIALRAQSLPTIQAATAASSTSVLRLAIEGIHYNKAPDVWYEVYLNLPERITSPSTKSVYYVGNLVFFDPADSAVGSPPATARTFDVTRTILGLRLFKLWNDRDASVTFVVRPFLNRQGRPRPVRPGVRLRFTTVRILASAEGSG